MEKIDLSFSDSKSHLHGCGLVEVFDDVYMFYNGYFLKATFDVLTGYELYKKHQQKGEKYLSVINQLKGQIRYIIEKSEEKEYIDDFVNRLIAEEKHEVIVTSLC